MSAIPDLTEEEASLCTKCGVNPRIQGGRVTWCRPCKAAWQRDYRKGVRLQQRIPEPVRNESGCLLWQGYIDPQGYGRKNKHGISRYAHRLAWEQAHGPIPASLTVDHLCCEKTCVETSHMELVTVNENSRRGGRARRFVS